MKKYWKSAAAIAVIVLSIGFFYISSAASKEENPNFVIKPLSGELPELKPIKLEGYYSDRFSDVSRPVSINAEGSVYQSRSFLSQLNGNPPNLIKELRKEHRAFMRGKDAADSFFYEDDQYLAYANSDYSPSLQKRDFKLTIALLNKENDRIVSFKAEVPDGKKIEYLYVEDVQMVDGELYVFTNNTVRGEKERYEEKLIYTIDVDKRKITSEESIIQIPEWQSDHYFDVRLIGANSSKANDHLIIVKTEIEMKTMEDGDSASEEVVNKEALSYNIATKEMKKLNVADLEYDGSFSFLDGPTVYFAGVGENGLLITPYHLAENQAGQPFSIDLPVEQDSYHSYITSVKDGKLYIAYSQMESGVNGEVLVVELQTGETLFQGQVALEDAAKKQGDFDLYIHELFVE